MQKRLLFLLALLMTFMSSAMAQVTTSSLSGTVVADGEEVIGATVDVVHKPSGTHYRAVTNDKGVYTINGMRVGGPYEVTVRVSALPSRRQVVSTCSWAKPST